MGAFLQVFISKIKITDTIKQSTERVVRKTKKREKKEKYINLTFGSYSITVPIPDPPQVVEFSTFFAPL